MALIKCPECSKEISDKSKCCPNCGCPSDEWTNNKVENSNTETENSIITKVENNAEEIQNEIQNDIIEIPNKGIVEEVVEKFPRDNRTLMVRELKRVTGLDSGQAITVIDTYLDNGVDLIETKQVALPTEQNPSSNNNPVSMVFCRWCGQKISSAAEFCDKCGHKVKSEEIQEERKEEVREQIIPDKKSRLCRNCGHILYKRERVCSKCGAIQETFPTQKVVATIITVVVFLLFVSVGFNSSYEPVRTTDTSGTVSIPAQGGDTTKNDTVQQQEEFYSIGQTAEMNDIQVTMLGYDENYGGQFIQPDNGNVFVLVEFEIVNNSKDNLGVSSMMSFDAYVDGYSTGTSISAMTSKDGANQLDGSIAPGKKMKGVVGYEVPKNWSELEISFTNSFWSNKKVKFLLNK